MALQTQAFFPGDRARITGTSQEVTIEGRFTIGDVDWFHVRWDAGDGCHDEWVRARDLTALPAPDSREAA